MLIISPVIKILLNVLPSEFSWRIPFGRMSNVRWCIRSANPGQALGRYEFDIESDMAALLSGSEAFWDVGSNVGWFALLACKLNKGIQVVAFEPDPLNLQYVSKHKLLNGFENITIESLALADQIGEAYFAANHQHGSLSETGDFLVKVNTADTYIDSGGLIPDLIKVDIEGGEVDFLLGAKQLLEDYRPTIVLSAHGYEKRDECIAILSEYEYDIAHLVADTHSGDYVFVARKSVSTDKISA